MTLYRGRGYVLTLGPSKRLHRSERERERERERKQERENKHPVYGQITGPLELSSRYDVSEFIRKVEECGAQPLSALTDGVHLHTLRCPAEDAFRRARAALDQAGFLVK